MVNPPPPAPPFFFHHHHERQLEYHFERSPRFGHSNNFSDLFSSDQQVVQDYIVGLLVVSLLILTAFVCWGFLLVVFKLCFGPTRVGFLSGAPFTRPSRGIINKWILRGRLVFGLSCMLFFIFAIVLVTAGIGNMNNTTTTIGDGALLGYDYLHGAQLSLNDVIVTLELLSGIKDQLLSELRDFLDALRAAQLVWQGSGNIEQTVDMVIDGMEDLGDFLQSPLKGIDNTLSSGQQTCQDVYDVTDQIDLRWLQACVGFVATLFPTLLLGYLYWAVFARKFNPYLVCFRNWIVWPCFVLLVIGCIVVCCVISIGGLLNADFCSGGPYQTPDATILEILNEQGSDPNSFEFRAIAYLVSGCDANALVEGSPLGNVEELESQLNNTLTELQVTIDDMITTGLEILTNETGYNATALNKQIEEFRVPLQDLFVILGQFLQSIACLPLYDVYYTVVHKATCNDSYTGTFWIFLSLLLMSFFGLLAITFRSALYPVALEESKTLDPLTELLPSDKQGEEDDLKFLFAHPSKLEKSAAYTSNAKLEYDDDDNIDLSSITMEGTKESEGVNKNDAPTTNNNKNLPSLLGSERSDNFDDEPEIYTVSKTPVPTIHSSSAANSTTANKPEVEEVTRQSAKWTGNNNNNDAIHSSTAANTTTTSEVGVTRQSIGWKDNNNSLVKKYVSRTESFEDEPEHSHSIDQSLTRRTNESDDDDPISDLKSADKTPQDENIGATAATAAALQVAEGPREYKTTSAKEKRGRDTKQSGPVIHHSWEAWISPKESIMSV